MCYLYKYNRAFTLIELMVVIAIVSILAAVSVGAYKQYALRVKVTNAMNTLDIFMDEAIKVHQLTGSFPTSYSVNGTDVGHCAWVWVDWSDTNTGWFSYCNNSANVTFTNSLLNLEGLPSYTAPTSSVRTDFSQVSAAVRYNNDGTYTKECGSLVPSNDLFVPLDYMPSNCRCADVNAWSLGGSC